MCIARLVQDARNAGCWLTVIGGVLELHAPDGHQEEWDAKLHPHEAEIINHLNGKPTAAELANAQLSDGSHDNDRRGCRNSQATKLIEMAGDAELFHDPDGVSFARVEVNGHYEVYAVRNRGFRHWIARRFYLVEAKAPGAQSLQDAIGVLEAKALYDGRGEVVHLRCAYYNGKVYVDLCNAKWQVAEVDADGWRILDQSPILFRRAKAMLPLPVPVAGGVVDELRAHVNVMDAEWPLFVGFLVGALNPRGPYAILAVHGEQGSAKSTVCRMARALVDPNSAPLRSEPREPRDLAIAANNGWMVALDNLSHIRPWLSDGLCRLSTGGGFATRALYENDEEQIFDAQRPILINGIEELASRSDLLDRCVLLNLPRIDAGQRITESELWGRFEEARPRIFGALLTAVSTALNNLPTTVLLSAPRMADFATWATAAEPGLGLRAGEFLRAYNVNRAEGNELAIEACPVGKAIMVLVEGLGAGEFDNGRWRGTATELLEKLGGMVDDQTRKSKAWPSSARSLGGIVKRLAPNLRSSGVEVDYLRGTDRKRKREILLSKSEQKGEPSPTPSALSAPHGLPSGEADDNVADDDPAPAPSSAVDCGFLDDFGAADAMDDADATPRLLSKSAYSVANGDDGVPF